MAIHNDVYVFLTKNNYRNLHAFSNNELEISDIQKVNGSSRQFVHSEIQKLDSDIAQKRYNNMVARLQRAYDDLKQGIPLSTIAKQKYSEPIFTKGNYHNDEVYLRTSIINRFRRYEILDSEDDLPYIMTSKKLEQYLKWREIIELLKKYYQGQVHHKSLMDIAKMTNSSYTQIANIKQRLYEGRLPTDNVPEPLFDLIYRNSDIANAFFEGQTYDSIAENYDTLDERQVQLIV